MYEYALIPLFISNMRGWQLIVIVILAFLLFGGVKKIPELMRNAGKGVHAFRQGLEDAKEEMNKPVERRGESAGEKDAVSKTEESAAPKDVER